MTTAELIKEIKQSMDARIAHRFSRDCRLLMRDGKGWELEITLGDLVSLVAVECAERLDAGLPALFVYRPSAAASDGDRNARSAN